MSQNINKKAALFGLDIRIALIVFTIFSLLTVANVVYIISQSKANQLLSDLNSIKLAYKNFTFDTQYNLTKYEENPYYYNLSELIELAEDSNKPYTLKYNGPYLESYKKGSTTNLIKHPMLNKNIAFVSRSYKNSFNTADKLSECSDSDCFVWAVVFDLSKSLAESIDLEVDGKVNHSKGKIRIETEGNQYNLYYPIKREN